MNEPPATMAAVSIREPEPPEVLEFVSTPTPAPGECEVLPRVEAAGVNRHVGNISLTVRR